MKTLGYLLSRELTIYHYEENKKYYVLFEDKFEGLPKYIVLGEGNSIEDALSNSLKYAITISLTAEDTLRNISKLISGYECLEDKVCLQGVPTNIDAKINGLYEKCNTFHKNEDGSFTPYVF